MNTIRNISEKLSTPTNELLIFLFGMLALFAPYLHIWSLVVFPRISLAIFLVMFWKGLFFLALGLLFLNLVATFSSKKSALIKFLSPCFLVLLIWAYQNIDTSLFERSFKSTEATRMLVAGGQARISWAGGSEHVKKEVLALLDKQTDESGKVDPDMWENSIRWLGAENVRVDKQAQCVIISLPISFFYDFDEFGYLISKNARPDFDILETGMGPVRYWKIGEGVYFFHRHW